jgi:hypothetical protein
MHLGTWALCMKLVLSRGLAPRTSSFAGRRAFLLHLESNWWLATELHRPLLCFRQALSCESFRAGIGPPARNRTWFSRLSVERSAVELPEEGPHRSPGSSERCGSEGTRGRVGTRPTHPSGWPGGRNPDRAVASRFANLDGETDISPLANRNAYAALRLCAVHGWLLSVSVWENGGVRR